MNATRQGFRRKVVWGGRAAMAVLLSSFMFGGCGKAVRQGRGAADLVIEQIVGASGAEPDQFGHVLASDVITIVDVGDVQVPTVFEDPGRAQFRVVMKDQGIPSSPTTPSANNQITITRYHVTYTRADGRNTQGIDVPWAFDGVVTQLVGAASTQVVFTLVRASAKTEAPLQALIGAGGANFISAFADVTFYGHDLAGNAVSARGRIGVNFADWGDPQ